MEQNSFDLVVLVGAFVAVLLLPVAGALIASMLEREDG